MDIDLTGQLNAALSGRYAVYGRIETRELRSVYVARDLLHNRDVAVKVVNPGIVRAAGREQLCASLARTAAVRHPNIVPLLDVGEADGFLFYAEPLLSGATLLERLSRAAQPDVDAAVSVAEKLADALDHAHQRGVCHGELTRENVLFHNDSVMITDFGIEATVGALVGKAHRFARLFKRLPRYLRAHRDSEGKRFNASNDLHSLGDLVHGMLSGKPPHKDSAVRIALYGLAGMKPPAPPLPKSIPENIREAVAKQLSTAPVNRFGNGQAFAFALRDAGFRRYTGFRHWLQQELDEAADTMSAGTRLQGIVGLGLVALIFLMPFIRDGVVAVEAVSRSASRMFMGLSPPGPVVLVPVPMRSSLGDSLILIDGSGDISEDGTRVVFAAARPDNPVPVAYYWNAAKGGAPVAIRGTEGAEDVSIAPSGRLVAFAIPFKGLRRVPLERGYPADVTADTAIAFNLKWGPNDYIYFNRSLRSGTFSERLWRVRAGGGNSEDVGMRGRVSGFLPNGGFLAANRVVERGPNQYMEPGFYLHVSEGKLLASPVDSLRKSTLANKNLLERLDVGAPVTDFALAHVGVALAVFGDGIAPRYYGHDSASSRVVAPPARLFLIRNLHNAIRAAMQSPR